MSEDAPVAELPAYPSHHPSWGTWGEREIGRFKFRSALFQRRGLSEPDAETLADRLAERDYERDDRRVCIECAHWQRSRTCFKKLPTSFVQLVRCVGFKWQAPN